MEKYGRPHNLHTRTEVMKPAHIFRDQVNTVAQWFDQWNDIEQTIACYSLLKRLGPTQARFLSLVLDYTFRDSAYEVEVFEKEANDKEFLRGLCHESKEVAVQQLLLHLPLLHPGNDEARHEYLKLLPKILSHSLEYSIHEEECRQLLSLALVHPAFVPEERNSLTWWLGLLEDKGDKLREGDKLRGEGRHPPPGFNPGTHPHLTGTKSVNEFYNSNKSQHAAVTNTYSYKGMSSNGWKAQSQLAHTDSGIGTSFDNGSSSSGLGHYLHKSNNRNNHDADVLEEIYPRPNRSKSFPVDPGNLHTPLSPQSSLDSDDDTSASKLASLSSDNAHPGMKDVPIWLKSLRLHKYAHIFSDMTYEEMLNLNEDYLEKNDVTKGARKKIIICIQKIKERRKTLGQLEKEVLQLGRLHHVLAELKAILMSPIRPPKSLKKENNLTDEMKEVEELRTGGGDVDGGGGEETVVEEDDDLASEITRVMGKACTQILVTQPDEECCLTYLGLLDRVLSHEAFSQPEKKRLHSWKSQCQKLACQLATNRKLAGIEKGPKNWYDPLGCGVALGRRRPISHTNSLKGSTAAALLPLPPAARAGPLCAAQNLHKRVTLTTSYNVSKQNHQSLSRTKSAPIRSSNVIMPLPGGPPVHHQDSEGINQSLETLCLSMTNHALEDTLEKGEEAYK